MCPDFWRISFPYAYELIILVPLYMCILKLKNYVNRCYMVGVKLFTVEMGVYRLGEYVSVIPMLELKLETLCELGFG